MKNKIISRIIQTALTAAIVFAAGITAFAGGSVSISSAGGTTSYVSFEGTCTGVNAAVVVQILDSSDTILAMESFPVASDQGFGGTIDGLNLTDGASYIIRIADYDGGAWTKQTFTAVAPAVIVIDYIPEPVSKTVNATVSGNKAEVQSVDTSKITNGSEFTIDVSTMGKSVNEISIPAEALAQLIQSPASAVNVKLSNAELSIDKTAMQSIAEAIGDSKMELCIETGKDAVDKLSPQQSEALSSLSNTIVLSASIRADGKEITDFGGGSVEITLDYEWDGSGVLRAVYIADNGTLEYVPVSYKDGKASITLKHFSEYVIYQTDAPFADVKKTDYFYDSVIWAINKGITDGIDTTHFGPNDSCTRAQMVTFLWRRAGSPEPSVSECKFTDVTADAYYYKAVLWAVEKGITSGTGDTTFSPNDACTRAQAICFIYRYAGSSSVSDSNPFADVKTNDYFCNAVVWAAKNHITSGTSSTTFSPYDSCSRAQAVTFLHNY